MRVASPSTDVDDVQGLVQESDQGSQLREWKGILQVEGIG